MHDTIHTLPTTAILGRPWVCMLTLAGMLVSSPSGAQTAGQHTLDFAYTVDGATHDFQYLLFLPDTYGDDPAKKWPLIFFHHGAGENGSNIDLIKVHGPPKIVATQPDFPFVVVSPLVPTNPDFVVLADAWMALLAEVTSSYRVDSARLYITGLSQGGYLAWELIVRHPDTFAAAAPIAGGPGIGPICTLLRNFGLSCGGEDVEPVDPCEVRHIPMWVFHGDADSVVDPRNSRDLVETLNGCGGDVQLTLYPGVDHDSWTRTYADSALYDWMLSHTLSPNATAVTARRRPPVVWSSLRAGL